MVKCACKTLQGLPCKKEAVKMSKFCSVHKSRCVDGKSRPAPKTKTMKKAAPKARTAKAKVAKTSSKVAKVESIVKTMTVAEKKRIVARMKEIAAPGYKPKGKIVRHASPEIVGASPSPKSSPSKNHFLMYEEVRKEGRYNMFDPNARIATGLTEKQYRDVQDRYAELHAKYAK